LSTSEMVKIFGIQNVKKKKFNEEPLLWRLQHKLHSFRVCRMQWRIHNAGGNKGKITVRRAQLPFIVYG